MLIQEKMFRNWLKTKMELTDGQCRDIAYNATRIYIPNYNQKTNEYTTITIPIEEYKRLKENE